MYIYVDRSFLLAANNPSNLLIVKEDCKDPSLCDKLTLPSFLKVDELISKQQSDDSSDSFKGQFVVRFEGGFMCQIALSQSNSNNLSFGDITIEM